MFDAQSPPVQAHFVVAGKYHDVDFARLEILKLLAEHPRIRTTVACDFSNIDRLRDCSLLIAWTVDVIPTAAETAAIRDWVEAGGRWLVLHGTNSILRFRDDGLVDSPAERDDLMSLIGTQFVAHPPIGPFKVEVRRPGHPLVRGEVDFETTDELYLQRILADDLDILLETSFEGEATGFVESRWPKTRVPILAERHQGSGRILYYALGHCRSHYDLSIFMPFWPHPERCSWNYPVHTRLLRRCILWGMNELEQG